MILRASSFEHMIRRSGLAVVALAALALVVLAGCSAIPSASSRPSAVRPTAETSTPAPAALPGCADFVTPTAFGAALGADVVTPPKVYPSGAFAAAGGVGCELQFGEQGFENGAELMYQIVPASIGTPAELSGSQAEAGTPRCQTDPNIMRSNSGCEAVIVLDGWWVETRFSVNSSAQVQAAAVQPVLALIRAGLHGRTAPTVTALTAPNCDRFASVVAADLGYAGATVATSPPSDSAGDTRSGWPQVAVDRVVASAACEITATDGTKLDFSMVRSPAVAAACAATTGATIWPEASGLTVASTPYVSGGADLCATDGVGSVTTSGASSDDHPAFPMWDTANVTGITPLLTKPLAAAR